MFIALIDNATLQQKSSLFLNSKLYSGHYILLTGYDENENKITYLDPAVLGNFTLYLLLLL